MSILRYNLSLLVEVVKSARLQVRRQAKIQPRYLRLLHPRQHKEGPSAYATAASKSLVCDVCNKVSFGPKGNLNKHKVIHEQDPRMFFCRKLEGCCYCTPRKDNTDRQVRNACKAK